ncbi:MAG: hypothetical protein U0228_35525 [Myxococcaceae bacterium]
MTATETPADREQLNLLRIFWFVISGLHALFGLFPLIYMVLGAAIVSGGLGSAHGGDAKAAEAVGIVFIVVAVILMLVIWTAALLSFLTARRIGERRSPTFIMIVAAINCLSVPIGTALGVFTFIVMSRPSVKASFGAST